MGHCLSIYLYNLRVGNSKPLIKSQLMTDKWPKLFKLTDTCSFEVGITLILVSRDWQKNEQTNAQNWCVYVKMLKNLLECNEHILKK